MVRPQMTLFFVLSLCLTTVSQADEKPTFGHLYPPGAQSGKANSIVVEGEFKSWPVQIWCSAPDIVWKAKEKAGEFEVQVPANAREGLEHVRFYNDKGATKVGRFFVSKQPVVLEAEPNNKWTEAQPIDAVSNVYGVLHTGGESDLYRVRLQKNQRWSVVCDAYRNLQSPMDAHLQILDERGFVLLENLDHFDLDPAFEFVAPRDGDYGLRIFCFPSEPNSTISIQGAKSWVYRLRCCCESLMVEDNHELDAIGIERNSMIPGSISTDTAAAASLPLWATGTITEAKQLRSWRIESVRKLPLEFHVWARSIGSPLDPRITIRNLDGKPLHVVDDSNKEKDPRFIWQAPDVDAIVVELDDFHRHGSAQHDFQLSVRRATPKLELRCSSELLESQVDKSFSIDVTASKTLEVDGAYRWEAVQPLGLVIAEPNVGKEVIAKAGKMTIQGSLARPYQGVIELRLVPAEGNNNPIQTVDFPKAKCWLSVVP